LLVRAKKFAWWKTGLKHVASIVVTWYDVIWSNSWTLTEFVSKLWPILACMCRTASGFVEPWNEIPFKVSVS
jgi:hypothetical protein